MCDENYLKRAMETGNFEISPCDPIRTGSAHLVKLQTSFSQKAQISLLASQLPTLIAAESISGAYRISFPDGLPQTLMSLKQGGYATTIKGADGKIAGSASLYPINTEPLLLNVFSALSIATGQYFMAEISDKLGALNEKIDKIIDFLYDDKKAELIAEISFVQYAFENYTSIMNHEAQRAATIASLQASKKVAMKDIEFYTFDLDSKTKPAKSYSAFTELSDEAFHIKDSLELSVQLYAMSSIMEMCYSQNCDQSYMASVKDNIMCCIEKSDRRILANFSKLSMNNMGFKSALAKKADVQQLGQKFARVTDLLSDGKKSKTYEVIEAAFQTSPQNREYFMDKDGNVYTRLY